MRQAPRLLWASLCAMVGFPGVGGQLRVRWRCASVARSISGCGGVSSRSASGCFVCPRPDRSRPTSHVDNCAIASRSCSLLSDCLASHLLLTWSLNFAMACGRCGDEQGNGEDEAQELAFPDSACAALFRVDFQPQMSADPLADVFQHSLRSVVRCSRRCCSHRRSGRA